MADEKSKFAALDLNVALARAEAELQARDIVIAVLKSERTKRLLYPHDATLRKPTKPRVQPSGTATIIPKKQLVKKEADRDGAATSGESRRRSERSERPQSK